MWILLYTLLYICVVGVYFLSEELHVRMNLRQRRTFWTLSTAVFAFALFFFDDRPIRLPWIFDHPLMRFGFWLSTIVLVRRLHWLIVNAFHLTKFSHSGVRTLKSIGPRPSSVVFLPYNVTMGTLLDSLLAPFDELASNHSESESESDAPGSGRFDQTRRKHADSVHLERIRYLVHELLDSGSVEFLAPRAQRKVAAQIDEVIERFQHAHAAQLNYWLPQLNFPKLLSAVGSSRNAFALMDKIIAVQSKLSVLSLTVVIDGIQKVDDIFKRSEKNELLATLVCCAEGATLRDLKMVIDHKGSHHNMNRLIYTDINNPLERQRVLEHIEKQARVYANDRCIKVLSDIDDTLFASGGPPGGVDRVYPRGFIYPGVIEFYLELMRGGGTDSSITFISARPSVGQGMTEGATYKRLQKIWNERKIPSPTPNLLPGSLLSSTRSTIPLVGDMRHIAEKKFKSFMEYSSIYPEAKFVFVGDNGQGDVQTAQMMRDRLPDRVLAAFIHDVSESSVESPTSSKLISFHRTYIGAAIAAFAYDMISCAGLYSVANAAVRQLEEMTVRWPFPISRARYLEYHQRDLEYVTQLLISNNLIRPPIHFTDEITQFIQDTLHPKLDDEDDDADLEFDTINPEGKADRSLISEVSTIPEPDEEEEPDPIPASSSSSSEAGSSSSQLQAASAKHL